MMTWSKGGRRIVFESVLIILAVLLGFAVSSWGERRADRELAEAALANFRAEIEANLGELERAQPKHVEFAQRLGDAAGDQTSAEGDAAYDAFVRARPEGGLDTPILREAAWEAALTTGALRLVDYDIAALLSETYLLQRYTTSTLVLLRDRFLDTRNFDPVFRDQMVRVHQMVMDELAREERYLMDAYRRTLDRLP